MDDLISRRAAIDALAKQMPRSYTPDGSHPADEEIYKAQEIYVDCIESIEILPAVQPERKQGKWESTGWWGRIHKCSQCGNVLDFDGVNAGRGDANFCPNCGADMRQKEGGT